MAIYFTEPRFQRSEMIQKKRRNESEYEGSYAIRTLVVALSASSMSHA